MSMHEAFPAGLPKNFALTRVNICVEAAMISAHRINILDDEQTEAQPVVSLEACPALVLNADGRPLSYFPLSVWSWQEAVKAVFLGRVQTLSEYDRMVRSPSFEMQLPSVIALREYISLNKRPAFTRFNVFLRDRFSCQYCGRRFETRELTFDHVIPRSRGGRTSWINVVTACRECNMRKSNRMPGEARMPPRAKPAYPTTYQLRENGRAFPPNFLHEDWRDYLYWDSELESD